MTARHALCFASLLLITACQAEQPAGLPDATATDDAPGMPVVPAPLETEDAYALAGTVEVAERTKTDHADLHNLFRLSDNIYSGGEPLGQAALKRVADLGVKTILSVDGKVPDAEYAASLGMRYVHVPIQYSGIGRGELMKISKTFRELEGPFFVHCFHGKHRGPAGAMIGRLALDGVSRETALADMRQCGTAEKYAGLYATVAAAEIPSAEETAAWDWDFPAAHRASNFRRAMVGAARPLDNLILLGKGDFAADPEHPDLDAINEATIMHDLTAQMESMKVAGSDKADFREWMAASTKTAAELRDALQAIPGEGDAAVARARASLGKMKKLCSQCHNVYRNK